MKMIAYKWTTKKFSNSQGTSNYYVTSKYGYCVEEEYFNQLADEYYNAQFDDETQFIQKNFENKLKNRLYSYK